MRSPAALLAPIREWFLLERAESTIRSYTSAQQAAVRAHCAAAELRLRAARSLADPVAACVLVRDAALHLLRANRAAAGAVAPEDGVPRSGELAVDPAILPSDIDPATSSRAEALGAAVASRDPLYFDHLPEGAAERLRTELDFAAGDLRRRIEPRSATNVRGTRWGRVAALGVVFSYVAYSVFAAVFLPTNLALHKPVYPSSYKVNPPDGHELVDGERISSFGVHTNTEDSPRVTIDLLGIYKISTIKVYNRGDGWFDDCLPLVVEMSADGQNYFPVGRRDTHFAQEPPWVLDAQKHQARYVRLRVDRRSYLALSEVEVFGKR
jgi:hypothetical protein